MFSAVGVDHAIEHENRTFKVLGGIKGIAINRKTLDENFHTVSEMRNIIEDFCEVFNIQNKATKPPPAVPTNGVRKPENQW